MPDPITRITKPTESEFLSRLMNREGGYQKVTTDSGGRTKGGIAESSGAFTADQIEKLNPQQIDRFWSKKLQQTQPITHPGVREIIFDMEANMGPRAWAFARREANQLLPADQRLSTRAAPLDPTAASRINRLEQDVLAARLMNAFKGHHESLVNKNPAKYKPYAKGWANRRDKLWNSPPVQTLHPILGTPVQVQPPQQPGAANPVKVKLPPPPPGYQVVREKKAAFSEIATLVFGSSLEKLAGGVVDKSASTSYHRSMSNLLQIVFGKKAAELEAVGDSDGVVDDEVCKCEEGCQCKHKEASKPGLWANINAKKKRGEKPAKPGDKDYPDEKAWKETVAESKSAALRDLVFGQQPETIWLFKSATPAWQRSEGKNPEGGLNAKGRASYKAETGGTLKAPVTEKNPKGERASRRKSFCSRMCGMKRVNTGAETKKDPDSRINKSLRKWNCKCATDLQKAIFTALQ